MTISDNIKSLRARVESINATRSERTILDRDLSERIEKDLYAIEAKLGTMVEYQPGDKAKLQALLQEMASNSDTTGAKKVLIRWVGEMDD